jgi:hypothetical protein
MFYMTMHASTNTKTNIVTLFNHTFTNQLVINRRLITQTLIVLCAILLIHYLSSSAEATNVPTLKYNILAVEYSEGCETMLTHHINTTCPTLDKIWKYDTSNKLISGKLLLSNGIFSRTNPEVKNHYLWYVTPKTIICVDCNLPLDQPDIFKTIFIEPSSFTFINKTYTLNNTNAYSIFSNRFVSENCMSATIGYSDSLLNDTINYMLSNCTITHIKNTQTNYIKNTPFQYANPFSTLHYQKQVQDLKKSGLNNCLIDKCNIINPYAKTGWTKQ